MQNDLYSKVLERQSKNIKRPTLQIYFSELYAILQQVVDKKQDLILELGSGTGTSEIFLKSLNILRTDFLSHGPQSGVVGGVDAQSLPFPDNSFSLVYGVDMLHHCPNPIAVLLECLRVANKETTQGTSALKSTKTEKIVFIEPWISPLSYPVYKLFHPERASWKIPPKDLQNIVSTQADDGDQCVAKSIIETWQLLQTAYPQLRNATLEYELLHPFSFFLTGGINRPLPIPIKILRAFLNLEKRLTEKMLRLSAARVVMRIKM
jgi:SAM-dependent methyltransferase